MIIEFLFVIYELNLSLEWWFLYFLHMGPILNRLFFPEK